MNGGKNTDKNVDEEKTNEGKRSKIMFRVFFPNRLAIKMRSDLSIKVQSNYDRLKKTEMLSTLVIW